MTYLLIIGPAEGTLNKQGCSPPRGICGAVVGLETPLSLDSFGPMIAMGSIKPFSKVSNDRASMSCIEGSGSQERSGGGVRMVWVEDCGISIEVTAVERSKPFEMRDD